VIVKPVTSSATSSKSLSPVTNTSTLAANAEASAEIQRQVLQSYIAQPPAPD
jgi:hypothetical protein